MSEKKTWRVGYYVEVEVVAHESEAHIVAESATGWPGDWYPPLPPVTVKGKLNRDDVEARIIRSEPLMIKAIDE